MRQYIVERELRRSLDRERHVQTWTRLEEKEAQLTSDRDSRAGRSLTSTRLDRDRQTRTRLTDIERKA